MVTSWGARGDGLADDSSSIQAVLDDANCSEVVFPSGTFSSGALTVSRPDVTLTLEAGAQLEGAHDKIKQCDNEADWKV